MSSGPSGLITTFTPAASCTPPTPPIYQIWTNNNYYYLQGPLLTSQDCYPSGYNAARTQFYSPAACPAGYTPACQGVDSVGSATETVQICCPTQMSYSCMNSPTLGYESTLACTTQLQSDSSMTSVTVISELVTSILTTAFETASGSIGAHGVQIRFQQPDQAPLVNTVLNHVSQASTNPTATATAMSTLTVTSSASSSSPSVASSGSNLGGANSSSSSMATLHSTVQPASQMTTIATFIPPSMDAQTSSTPASNRTGFSPALTAGIGVASAVGAFILATVLGLLYFQHWRKTRIRSRTPTRQALHVCPPYELSNESIPSSNKRIGEKPLPVTPRCSPLVGPQGTFSPLSELECSPSPPQGGFAKWERTSAGRSPWL